MPLLFSYGTLRDPQVQVALFGRTLAGRKDSLPGFEQATVEIADPAFATESGTSCYPILRASTTAAREVEGTVFEISGSELARADAYEPAEYRRVMARLASGGQAWVYVESREGGEHGTEGV